MMTTHLDADLNLKAQSTNGFANALIAGDNLKNLSSYQFYTDYYYPYVVKESYPVYLSERARDKGKEAFEIIKMLKDKRFLKLEMVSEFIDIMDELIKIL